MNQINSDTYKKRSLMQQFFQSCLGKIVILLGIFLGLYIFAIITVPSEEMMMQETLDNIHECLQENDSIKADEIDEFINNISRTISFTDTTATNQETYKAFKKYNRLEVYNHTGFKTIYLFNGIYPQGQRIGIGIFQTVICTLFYDELVISTGAVRGDYNKSLTAPPPEVHDVEFEDTIGSTNVNTYHYEGNIQN